MQDAKIIRSIGEEAPILAEGRRTPDRREVSLRWLSGTFLTGITSSILMGVALFAALEGRELLAIPAEAAIPAPELPGKDDTVSTVQKGGRLVAASIAAKPADKQIMDVPTVVVEGEKQVVRKRPFAHVKMALAANYPNEDDYPNFDPLNIVADGDKAVPAAPSPVFYGSDVDSEVALKVSDFPTRNSPYKLAEPMSLDEVEENVRTNGSLLTSDNSQVATLSYVDPQRFSGDSDPIDMLGRITAKVVEENTTVSALTTTMADKAPEYADDIIPVRAPVSVSTAITASGYTKAVATDIEDFVSSVLQKRELAEGDVIRVGVVQEGEKARVVRVSIYSRGVHQLTVAIDDKGKLVTGSEPPVLSAVASAFDDNASQPVADNRDLPRVYDGIYRAALSYGMSKEMTARVIRLLSSNVDFQARLKPTDQLEAFYSVADESGEATDQSELLFIHAKFGDTDTRLYRFQDPTDMSVDYYDQNGKSLKQFLIRNPLPGGVFKSGFGMRRHPILGYMRMHTGVDWAAPRGTPIIAAGDGVVIKAGWDKGGYGNQTLIQHPNGYITSYNHQSAIARDVVEGAHVRQGQIIGWVGTTGQSTGPHLHYEVIVNGNKVDPQRIRLPAGKSLKGELLARFEDERKRIDDLLSRGETKQVASQ